MAADAHDLVFRHLLPTMDWPLSLIDRCYGFRDALLGNPVFQRLSASFPLSRPIAQTQARALFDLCAGFVYSQVLTACVRLDLFRKLASGSKTIAQLSDELELPAAATERLLLAAVSLRLISRRSKDRFGLGVLGAAFLGNPGIAAMIAHHEILYRDLQDPVALLRGTGQQTNLAAYWAYAGSSQPERLEAEDVNDYSTLMARSQSLIASDVLDAYPFEGHQCLLDVGGGDGVFIDAVAERYPKLRFMLFDLPPVAERARGHFASGRMASRLTVHGGNFLTDPLPPSADLVSLVRVVHDHDDATVMALFNAVYQSLPPGGSVLVAEPMASVPGVEPVGDAYFGMYLLAMGQGRPRRPDEIVKMLQGAGFTNVTARRTRRPMLVGAVSGLRP